MILHILIKYLCILNIIARVITLGTPNILIIDDDKDIIEFASLYLLTKNLNVLSANSVDDALSILHEIIPDVIILDVMLGESTGFDLCKKIRSFSDIPIIFLSCLSSVDDKVNGFMSGGDDYLTKPFSPRELYYRVKVALKRNTTSSDFNKNQESNLLNFPSLEIDINKRLVFLNKNLIELSIKEFDLLVILAKNPTQVFTLEELFFYVWKIQSHGDTRTVYVHISNLRKKINNADDMNYINTVRGRGYRFLPLSKKQT